MKSMALKKHFACLKNSSAYAKLLAPFKFSALAWLAMTMFLLQPAANAEYTPKTVYQLPVALTDQDNNDHTLDIYAGHPVIISMFYGKCPHVCPMLLSTIQMTENQLAPEARAKLRVLLISLDPDNDTPAVLKKVAERHHIDRRRWKLSRAATGDVRKIAAVLGIRYRQLEDGEFNHSTVISLLNAQGEVSARTSKLPGVDMEFLRKLETEIK